MHCYYYYNLLNDIAASDSHDTIKLIDNDVVEIIILTNDIYNKKNNTLLDKTGILSNTLAGDKTGILSNTLLDSTEIKSNTLAGYSTEIVSNTLSNTLLDSTGILSNTLAGDSTALKCIKLNDEYKLLNDKFKFYIKCKTELAFIKNDLSKFLPSNMNDIIIYNYLINAPFISN